MKKVSIIIPMYNEENRIKKCIDSLISQTYDNIEIIVVNDGSTDNSLEVVKNIKHPKIKIYTIKNHGQAYARNYGMKKSTGDLIMFVDSDDYVEHDIVEKLYNSMKENNSEISICNIVNIYKNKQVIFKNYNSKFDNPSINFMISHPGPVARLYEKKLFVENDIKFLEGYYYEDLATIPLLGLHTSKISFIDEPLYYYVIHKNSTMHRSEYSDKLKDIFFVMDFLNKKFDNTDYYEVIEYLNIEHLLYSAVLRFSDFEDGLESCRYISNYIKENFNDWRKNYIYKTKSFKFKLVCNLSYLKMYSIINFLKRWR